MSSICDIMADESNDPYDNLVQLMIEYRAYFGKTGCVNVNYWDMIEYMRFYRTDSRSWIWQSCNEFGYFQSSDASDQPFSHLITIQFWIQQCQDIFGITAMQPNVNYTNEFYGGANIVTSNTVFTNGMLDPWHRLSNFQNYSVDGDTQNILMNGTAHCRDLEAPEQWDPPQLIVARFEQARMIEQWLSDDKAAKAEAKAASNIAVESLILQL